MQNLNFWVYSIEKEFNDFKPALANQLQVADFFHDCESYCECQNYRRFESSPFKIVMENKK